MSAFTEVAEIKTKIAKSVLYFQSSALAVRYQLVAKIENWKNTETKNYFRR